LGEKKKENGRESSVKGVKSVDPPYMGYLFERGWGKLKETKEKKKVAAIGEYLFREMPGANL